jgi:hypothetical protein
VSEVAVALRRESDVARSVLRIQRQRTRGKVKVLLVSTPALAQLIQHLFRGRPEFEVVGSIAGLKGLAERSERPLPQLIVASVKPVTTSIRAAVIVIKRYSPSSKLILISPVSELISGVRNCSVDACLEQEKLVPRLVPTACALFKDRAGIGISSHA